jgi:hypothetical protein
VGHDVPPDGIFPPAGGAVALAFKDLTLFRWVVFGVAVGVKNESHDMAFQSPKEEPPPEKSEDEGDEEEEDEPEPEQSPEREGPSSIKPAAV